MKHVAIVCPALGRGEPVANVALNHARELAPRFRVTLISDDFPARALPGTEQVRIRPRGFRFLRRYAAVPRELAFALAARRAVAALHARTPVDVLVCHGHPVATLAARPLQRRLGIPFALVTHGDIFDRPKGTYDARRTWFYQRTTPPAYRAADLVVTLSPHMARLATRGGAELERVVVIPNGVELAEIGLGPEVDPAPHQHTSRFELLYVGRLSIEKGVDLLIEAAALLARHGLSFQLRIAGTGARRPELEALVQERGLAERVAFLGVIPRAELGALYRSADVLCVPSRSDPLPTVVLEAMAAGLPVVGADTGGIPFMVEHETTGLIHAANDAAALADALARLAADPALVRRLGEAGRQRGLGTFSWTHCGQALGDALDRLSHSGSAALREA